MTNKELVIGFFMEGYVHHNYDFLMKNMAADYFDNSPCAARSSQECVNILKNTEKTFTDMEVEILDLIEEDNNISSGYFFFTKWFCCLQIRAEEKHSDISKCLHVFPVKVIF